MVSWFNVAKEAFEVFEDVRSAISMYMFIIEEAIQTANMANWILWKVGAYDEVKYMINWIRDNLANPLLDFSKGEVAMLAYPMNLAYEAFAKATIQALGSMEIAIEFIEEQTE